LQEIKRQAALYRGGAPRVRFFEFAPNRLPAEAGELDGWELDLSAAYCTVAARDKLLTLDLCREIARQPKIYRLRLLGAMATRKTIYQFDRRGKITAQRDEYCPHGVKLWRRICAAVGDDMHETAKGDGAFLGFWVDNYFCTAPDAETELTRRGYRVKKTPAAIAWRQDDNGWQLDVNGRPFCFPRANRWTAARLKELHEKGLALLRENGIETE